jgi:CRP-like cAMP-binding protein
VEGDGSNDQQDDKAADISCETCHLSRLGFCRFFKSIIPDAPAPFFRGRERLPRRRTIYRESEPIKNIYVIRDGWAFRYMLSQDGRRQILSFLMPGDLVSPSSIFAKKHQFSVQSLTAMDVCVFDAQVMRDLCRSDETFFRRVIATCLEEKEYMERKLFELGRCRAEERVAQMLLYLETKQTALSLKKDDAIQFPLRQQDVADALGLTQVHVSRILNTLRQKNIIENFKDMLAIRDVSALKELASGGVNTF